MGALLSCCAEKVDDAVRVQIERPTNAKTDQKEFVTENSIQPELVLVPPQPLPLWSSDVSDIHYAATVPVTDIVYSHMLDAKVDPAIAKYMTPEELKKARHQGSALPARSSSEVLTNFTPGRTSSSRLTTAHSSVHDLHATNSRD